jgi:hypothetical protein
LVKQPSVADEKRKIAEPLMSELLLPGSPLSL